MKKNWMLAAVMALSLSMALAPSLSEAKRLGGGRSSGMQRQAPDATPNRAVPAQQQAAPAAAPAQQGAAAVAAAAPKRNWMGPIAGLAAGLGIAALMSHFGMGEAFGNFLMMALLALVAVFAIRFLMNRFGRQAPGAARLSPAGAGAGMGGSLGGATWPGAQSQPVLNRTMDNAAAQSPVASVGGGGASANASTNANANANAFAPRGGVAVPASFDSEGFERIAKMLFIRLQAANDSGDLNDLRTFTTPEMFAEIKLDLQERGTSAQVTDVVQVDAQVLEVAQEAERQLVSVRFHGQIREEAGGPANDFDEVWHLVRFGDQTAWTISGIQQR